jgi:hypothetical protein
MKRARLVPATLIPSLMLALVALQSDAHQATPPGGTPSGDVIPGLVTYDVPSRAHTQGEVDYPQDPPVGGEHNPVWQSCGFYDQPVRNENAVHSLEHGAVWITYQAGLPADQVAVLREAAAQSDYVLVSPYPDLPAPVVASAWGKQLWLERADDPRLAQFIAAFAANGPEPGAPCVGGTDETVPMGTPTAGTPVASPVP